MYRKRKRERKEEEEVVYLLDDDESYTKKCSELLQSSENASSIIIPPILCGKNGTDIHEVIPHPAVVENRNWTPSKLRKYNAVYSKNHTDDGQNRQLIVEYELPNSNYPMFLGERDCDKYHGWVDVISTNVFNENTTAAMTILAPCCYTEGPSLKCAENGEKTDKDAPHFSMLRGKVANSGASARQYLNCIPTPSRAINNADSTSVKYWRYLPFRTMALVTLDKNKIGDGDAFQIFVHSCRIYHYSQTTDHMLLASPHDMTRFLSNYKYHLFSFILGYKSYHQHSFTFFNIDSVPIGPSAPLHPDNSELPPNWRSHLPLRPYQLAAVEWMNDWLQKMRSGHPSTVIENAILNHIPLVKGSQVFLCDSERKLLECTRIETVDQKYDTVGFDPCTIKGGMLASVTGNGKTAQAIALILQERENRLREKEEEKEEEEILLAALSPSPPNSDCGLKTVNCKCIAGKKLFKTHAVLVITPVNLPKQWYNELHKFTAPERGAVLHRKDGTLRKKALREKPRLKILKVLDRGAIQRLSLQDWLDADVIITSFKFITERYSPERASKRASNDMISTRIQELRNVQKEIMMAQLKSAEASSGKSIWRCDTSVYSEAVRNGLEEPKNIYGLYPHDFSYTHIMVDEVHEALRTEHTTRYYGGNFDTVGETFRSITRLSREFSWGITGTPSVDNMTLMRNYFYFLTQASDAPQGENGDRLPTLSALGAMINRSFLRSIETGIDVPIYYGVHSFALSDKEKALVEHQQEHQPENTDLQLQLICYFNANESVNSYVATNKGDHTVKLLTMDELFGALHGDREDRVKGLEERLQSFEVVLKKWKKQLQDKKTVPSRKKQLKAQIEEKEKRIEETKQDIEKSKSRLEYFLNQISLLAPSKPKSNSSNSNSNSNNKEEEYLLPEGEGGEGKQNQSEDIEELISHGKVCPICFCDPPDSILSCGHTFCECCLEAHFSKNHTCPMCRRKYAPDEPILKIKIQPEQEEDEDKDVVKAMEDDNDKEMEEHNSVTKKEIERYGTCLAHIVKHICDLKKKGEKALIFIPWHFVAKAVFTMLKEGGVSVDMLHGKNTHQRNAAVENFQKRDELDALLLSLESSKNSITGMENDSAGMNLTRANHIIFPFPPSADTEVQEIQAVARAHRMGQTKPVYVHRYIAKNTVSETMFKQYQQERKW